MEVDHLQTTQQIMELARQRYLDDLPFVRSYRPGKFTGLGFPRDERAVVCEVEGAGIFKRLWTTHSEGTRMKIYLYLDGATEPVLQGWAHEIGTAASRLSHPELPWGGFLDGKSVSLYLPYRFEIGFRLEAEPVGDLGDGPYWQVDYALDTDEVCGEVIQSGAEEEMRLEYRAAELGKQEPSGGGWRLLEEELVLAGCAPKGLHVDGAGVIRRICLTGEELDKLWLRMAFDGEPNGDGNPRGPFQVDAPLRYLVGEFNNVGVSRLGSQMEIHFPMPFRRRVDLQLLPVLGEGQFADQYRVKLKVAYEPDPPRLDEMCYFNAAFHSADTNGYDDFEVCSVVGQGHFVGVHLFDTGHDHGGGDNIMFDAPLDSAGQLHGICGEDYFHHAYMRTGVLAPYAGCPSHSARYRHHLEMPIPFRDSFVFNWGEFAGQAPRSVALWYQKEIGEREPERELTYRVTGPFPLDQIDALTPDAALPEIACPWPGHEAASKWWRKQAQRGFVDLCHVHRQHMWPVPPSTGVIPSGLCTYLETAVWAAREVEAELVVGCDDPIRLFVNGTSVFADDGRQEADPFRVFRVKQLLQEGLNRLVVVVGNRPNCNWHWNGFSLVLRTELEEDELLYLS